MKWQASAPSNIALIKYMGKIDSNTNIPSNASLSYTLNQLQTIVELTTSYNDFDYYEPLLQQNIQPIKLSEQAKQRFLTHLQRIKKLYDYKGHLIVRSNNSFPSDCGLASSASSFAALTKCAVNALSDLTNKPKINIQQQALLSQQASGSSCRSFFSPWAIWDESGVKKIDIPYPELIHSVVVVDKDKKKPSSSQAHQLVLKSELFKNRDIRSKHRLDNLITAFTKNNWYDAYQICWHEFWDMHALFETTTPAFGYISARTIDVLKILREYWQFNNDGPLITLDAGPNIHLLFRPDQLEMVQYFKDMFSKKYLVIL